MEPRIWIGPSILSIILIAQLASILTASDAGQPSLVPTSPRDVGLAMFGPYLLCVELASVLLLAAVVGAYRIAHFRHEGA